MINSVLKGTGLENESGKISVYIPNTSMKSVFSDTTQKTCSWRSQKHKGSIINAVDEFTSNTKVPTLKYAVLQ